MHAQPANNNWPGTGNPAVGDQPKQARVLYDYDAAGMNELSLKADEV